MAAIGINAHLLSGRPGYRRAGIHNYISGVLAHLPAREHLHYTVFTRQRAEQAPPQAQRVSTMWPTEKRWLRIAWEQLVWPLSAWRAHLDLLHSMAFVTPALSPCPTVVTIYDLSFIHHPDRFPLLQRLYLTSQTRRSCHQARRVVTISDAGRNDVQRVFGVSRDRIDVVQPGVGAAFRPRPQAEVDAFRQRHGLPPRFVLHVGTLQPRKNIPLLIEAMAHPEMPQIPLLLVGGKGWFYDNIFARVEALGLQDRVHFPGYVPDAELPLWYNAAALFVFPSLHEGFGLPVIEAMACGTPVVAADTATIAEAAGDAALRFPPHDGQALLNQMLAVLDNEEQAATMRERGIAHARTFSWVRSGRKMADVYERALL